MKATELRIGNYLNEDRVPMIIDVIYSDKYSAIKLITPQGNDIQCHIDFIKPIPLTEEWLLKFGFEKIDTNYQRGWLLLHGNNKTGTIDFLLNEPYSGKFNATILNYVHQLQNLYYALTGEELTIK